MIKALKSMPSVVFTLCFVKAVSTFSFAILFSSLSLYLTHQLNTTVFDSNGIVALFLAFNFLLQLFGGVMGGGVHRASFFVINQFFYWRNRLLLAC